MVGGVEARGGRRRGGWLRDRLQRLCARRSAATTDAPHVAAAAHVQRGGLRDSQTGRVVLGPVALVLVVMWLGVGMRMGMGLGVGLWMVRMGPVLRRLVGPQHGGG